MQGEGQRSGQRLFAVEPLRLAGGAIDRQNQLTHHEDGRAPFHSEAAILETGFEVTGEVEGQGVQSFLGDRGEGVRGFVHRFAIHQRIRVLQFEQSFLHGDGVHLFLGRQLAGPFQRCQRLPQGLEIRFDGLYCGVKLCRKGVGHIKVTSRENLRGILT